MVLDMNLKLILSRIWSYLWPLPSNHISSEMAEIKYNSGIVQAKPNDPDTNYKGTPPFPPLNGMTTLWSYLSLFTSDT